MRICVLGSSAGGGLPQWNCSCRNCDAARRGDPRVLPRTQSSIAVSPDGGDWVLINASPDMRTQMASRPELWPEPGGVRGTRVRAVVLADAQIDHTAGLLILREGGTLPLYTTASVREDLSTTFPVIPLLQHYCGVDWHEIPTDGREFTVEALPEIGFTAVPLTSKPPPYSTHRDNPRHGDNVGLSIRDGCTGHTAFYAPGLGFVDDRLESRMAEADCLLVDGTFWSEDEMARTGAGTKTASRMGHLRLSGDAGMLAVLQRLARPEKYLIHINNTNPILDAGSLERASLEAAGVALTHDGMTIEI